MGPLGQRGGQQQEGEVAMIQDLTGLLAGELRVDGFQAAMAGNVPNPELLAK